MLLIVVGIQKNKKARKKKKKTRHNPPRTRAIRPEQEFCTICQTFICLRPVSATGRSEPVEGSGCRRTKQPPQEGRRASKTPLSQRGSLGEMQTLWHPHPALPRLSNCYQTDRLRSNQALWKSLRLLALQRYLSREARSMGEGKPD